MGHTHAVALCPRFVRMQNAVCGAVVAGVVHGVAAGLVEACREAHVVGCEMRDRRVCILRGWFVFLLVVSGLALEP